MNIAELFNQKSNAQKVISMDEFAIRLQQVSRGELELSDGLDVAPLPPFEFTPRRVNAIMERSDKETYAWVGDPLALDKAPHGLYFKSGKAIGYDVLLDIAHGYEIEPRVVFTAFEACADHAPKLKAGQLKPKHARHRKAA